MSSANKPVLEIDQGELFCVETEDCYSGNLKSPQDKFTKDMWDTVNPATGPVYITGLEPGSILRVEIAEINIRDHAVMCIEHGAGALGEFIEGFSNYLKENLNMNLSHDEARNYFYNLVYIYNQLSNPEEE